MGSHNLSSGKICFLFDRPELFEIHLSGHISMTLDENWRTLLLRTL